MRTKLHDSVSEHRLVFLLLCMVMVVGALSSAQIGILVIALVLVVSITLIIVSSDAVFERVILLLLVSKPLVDLAWRYNAGTIAGQRLNLQALVGVYIVLLVLAYWIVRQRVLFSWPVAGLISIATLSLIFLAILGGETGKGVSDFLRLISGLCLFFVAGSILSRKQTFSRFAWLLLIAITVPLILSLFQLRGAVPYEYWDWIAEVKTGRLSGTYPHPVNLTSYLVYGHLLALYLVSTSRKRFHRLLLLSWMGLLYFVLIYTYHRSSYVVVALQLVGWLLLNNRWLVASVIMIGSGIIAVVQRTILMELFTSFFVVLTDPKGFFAPTFLRGRGEQLYRYLNDFVQSHPYYWIFGRGNSVLVGNYPEFVLAKHEPHNDYLRILYTYGILGVLFYLGIFISFTVSALRLRRIAPSRFEMDLSNLVLLSVASIAILSITVEPMRYPTTVWYFFAFGSAAIARNRQLALNSQRRLT